MQLSSSVHCSDYVLETAFLGERPFGGRGDGVLAIFFPKNLLGARPSVFFSALDVESHVHHACIRHAWTCMFPFCRKST